jgi:hypothetical protein
MNEYEVKDKVLLQPGHRRRKRGYEERRGIYVENNVNREDICGK